MKVIYDKKDKFGICPLWFQSHNLKDINEYLQEHYDGYKFAIIIDASKGERAPLEKPLPVYFLDEIADEAAEWAGKKLVDKNKNL